MSNKIHIAMITQPSRLAICSDTTCCPMRGGFFGTLIKNGNRGNYTPWVMSMGGGGGGGCRGDYKLRSQHFFSSFFLSFSSVDICSKLTFMKERLTPKPKPPFFSMTSLIQVFCKLSKLRACGYHQVVLMYVFSK